MMELSSAELDAFSKHLASIESFIAEINDGHTSTSLVRKLDKCLETVVALLTDNVQASGDPDADTKGPSSEGASARLMLLLQDELLVNLTRSCISNKPPGTRKVLVKALAALLRNVKEKVLVGSILLPLHETIAALNQSSPCDADEECHQVVFFNEICKRFSSDPVLLPLFFDSKSMKKNMSNGEDAMLFPVFSNLVGHMHDKNETGNIARESLLICASKLSEHNEQIGQYIAERSSFCQALVSWLTACFAALPPKLKKSSGPDWRMIDTETVPEITEYLKCLEYCDEVVEHADPVVVRQFVTMLETNFATPVLQPRLLMQSAAEALAATAYLQLSLSRISQYNLATPFVNVILNEHRTSALQSDAVEVVEVLMSRLEAKNDLPLATLRLFITLIDLNRHDVFYNLCIKTLFDDPRATVSIMGSRVQHCVVVLHASREFLRLRPGPYDSTPGGPDFEEYVLEAREGLNRRYTISQSWPKRYTMQDLKKEVDGAAQKAGLLGGVASWAGWQNTIPLKRGQFPGFWALLMTHLRQINSRSWKFNLLLTQLLTKIVQYPSSVWTSFVFSLSTSRAHPTLPTLYGVLADLAFAAGELEARGDEYGLATGLSNARANVAGKQQTQGDGASTSHSTVNTPAPNKSRLNEQASSSGSPSTPRRKELITPVTTPRSTNKWWGSASPSTPSSPARIDAKSKQKEIHGVLLLEELIKELAAIALEHSTHS